MTARNKEIVRGLNRAFEADDTEAILSCLADDIRWDVPGAFIAVGKEEFRKQVHNDAFVGAPTITVINDIAEGDYVAVEGRVESRMKNGILFKAVFHNTYRLENQRVKAMTSYVVPMI
jgi:ketosteroid isomerase-like protein